MPEIKKLTSERNMRRSFQNKLFNGYVREPIPMVILAIIPAIASLGLALWATWDFHFADLDSYTQVQTCVINEYREADTDYELVSSSGMVFCLPVDSVANASILDTLVQNSTCVLVEYSVERKEEYQLHDIVAVSYKDGTCIISEAEIGDVREMQWISTLAWLWGIFTVYATFLMVSYYILCNAPKYPRLANLLIRENWRNF